MSGKHVQTSVGLLNEKKDGRADGLVVQAETVVRVAIVDERLHGKNAHLDFPVGVRGGVERRRLRMAAHMNNIEEEEEEEEEEKKKERVHMPELVALEVLANELEHVLANEGQLARVDLGIISEVRDVLGSDLSVVLLLLAVGVFRVESKDVLLVLGPCTLPAPAKTRHSKRRRRSP